MREMTRKGVSRQISRDNDEQLAEKNSSRQDYEIARTRRASIEGSWQLVRLEEWKKKMIPSMDGDRSRVQGEYQTDFAVGYG